MKTTKFLLASAAALLFAVRAFAQGSLTPPGAPAPTFRTLSQVEPRTPISSIPITLTNGGSYYLTADLKQTNSAAGITLAASDITIDLNGFALIGTNGAGDGITRAGAILTNCCVRKPRTAVSSPTRSSVIYFKSASFLRLNI